MSQAKTEIMTVLTDIIKKVSPLKTSELKTLVNKVSDWEAIVRRKAEQEEEDFDLAILLKMTKAVLKGLIEARELVEK